MLKLYIFPISNLNWRTSDNDLLNFLPSPKKEKILEYRFCIDRKLALYADLLMRMELSKYLKISFQDLEFRFSKFGKPYLLYPSNLFFNYSHTSNCILLGLCNTGEIGVDIETIKETSLDIMSVIFHPIEKKYVSNSSEKHKYNNFFKIWTKKEAYTKFLGTGLFDSLNKINILDPCYAPSIISFTIQNYACSICSTYLQPFEISLIAEDEINQFYFFHS